MFTRFTLLALLLGALVLFLLWRRLSGAPADNDRLAQIRRRIGSTLTGELKRAHLRAGAPVFVRIFKEERLLEVWMRDEMGGRYSLFRAWPIAALGPGGLGPKKEEGDGISPEGFYHISARQMNPRSKFHLSFDLGFPNECDQYHGRTGTALMVHGDQRSVGCYAMTDPVIEAIYLLMDAALRGNRQDEIPVHCLPFRMTAARLARAEEEKSVHLSFWKNLKEGSDLFEETRVPPLVGQKNGMYVFRRQDPR